MAVIQKCRCWKQDLFPVWKGQVNKPSKNILGHIIHCLFSLVFDCWYCKTSNISRTLVGKTIVDNSDVVGASPVGAAPTTSSFST